jgi:1,2-diacylglycerol 3-alpha-glucosyltransferase
MRILVATTSQYIAFHGQAIFTINLSEGLVRRGHQVMVLSSSEQGRPYHTEINGVRSEALQSRSLGIIHPDSYLPILPGIMVNDVVDSFSPDVIHIQDHYPLSRAVVLAGKHRRISMVGTNHFMPENLAAYVPLVSKIKPVYNWVLWHWMLEVYNRLDAIAAPSKTAADLVRGQGARPPVYPISCGVNDQIFQFDPRVDRRDRPRSDRLLFRWQGGPGEKTRAGPAGVAYAWPEGYSICDCW